ncbi:HEAT repeat domain-containing protein [Candidatus Latescibacterota bacterium]
MIFKKGFHAGSVTCLLCLILVLLIVMLSSCGTRDVEMDTAIQEIVTYKFGDSREPLTVVSDLVTASKGFPSIRLNLEKQLVTVLASNATLDCKEFICRQLWIMGTDASVPQLSKMLIVEETSDIARYALETNSSELSGAAFRDALKTAQGKALIGIINSLGNRKDTESAEALKVLAAGSDDDVSSAATAALGKIRN